jgi:hypothetical protein
MAGAAPAAPLFNADDRHDPHPDDGRLAHDLRLSAAEPKTAFMNGT